MARVVPRQPRHAQRRPPWGKERTVQASIRHVASPCLRLIEWGRQRRGVIWSHQERYKSADVFQTSIAKCAGNVVRETRSRVRWIWTEYQPADQSQVRNDLEPRVPTVRIHHPGLRRGAKRPPARQDAAAESRTLATSLSEPGDTAVTPNG